MTCLVLYQPKTETLFLHKNLKVFDIVYCSFILNILQSNLTNYGYILTLDSTLIFLYESYIHVEIDFSYSRLQNSTAAAYPNITFLAFKNTIYL